MTVARRLGDARDISRTILMDRTILVVFGTSIVLYGPGPYSTIPGPRSVYFETNYGGGDRWRFTSHTGNRGDLSPLRTPG